MNYNIKSNKAEEFISHDEILETIKWVDSNRNNHALIDEILQKARQMKGITHREASLLLECDNSETVEEIFSIAKSIKEITR